MIHEDLVLAMPGHHQVAPSLPGPILPERLQARYILEHRMMRDPSLVELVSHDGPAGEEEQAQLGIHLQQVLSSHIPGSNPDVALFSKFGSKQWLQSLDFAARS